MATSSSKAKTQYIKSKKYTGISHRTTDNDTIYYCSYKTKKGNYSRFKCGYKSAGYSEKLAYEFMQSEKQKILNDIDTRFITIILYDYLYIRPFSFKICKITLSSIFSNSLFEYILIRYKLSLVSIW